MIGNGGGSVVGIVFIFDNIIVGSIVVIVALIIAIITTIAITIANPPHPIIIPHLFPNKKPLLIKLIHQYIPKLTIITINQFIIMRIYQYAVILF